ncbi:MAG: hypothetical protein BYD32DRAFT_402319 [Podila humilis]|nr:MAG: hypothetical protein BYD32DRAFT_402319 [Podila humilis]
MVTIPTNSSPLTLTSFPLALPFRTMATTDVTATILPLPHCLSTIPTEVAELILTHLSQSSLAACAIVSKAWHTLCNPFLLRTFPWRAVDISTPEHMIRFMSAESQRALYRNAAHIHSLCLWYPAAYDIFDPSLDAAPAMCGPLSRDHHGPQACIHLRRLEFGLHGYSSRTSPKKPCLRMDQTMVQLIRQNPGLKELLIYRPFFPYRILSLLMHDLPNLQVLDLGSKATAVDQGFAKVLLAHLPESICSVKLYVQHGGSVKVGSRAALLRDHLAYTGPPRQHLRLESLSVKGETFNNPEHYKFLLSFLKTCGTKLSTFNTPDIYWFYHTQIRKRLARLGVFLQTLENRREFVYGQVTGDTKMAELIRSSPRWREINFEYWQNLGPLTAAAVGENCEYLVSLQLQGCGMKSAQIRLILGKVIQLKKFNALGLYSSSPADPFITAADMALLEWGSPSLEEFKCKIEVPRPDSCDENMQKSGASSSPCLKSLSEAMGASRALQRQVYQKLAELPFLRILCLGVAGFTTEPQSSPYQKQCLEWSLESGLEAVAEKQGFQNLQCLSVCTMAHRISIAELEWMNRSWPKLGCLEGMFSRCPEPVPGAREWMEDHRPDWTTSADLEWFATYGNVLKK